MTTPLETEIWRFVSDRVCAKNAAAYQDGQKYHEIHLRIAQDLKKMVWRERAVHNACLVDGYMMDDGCFLLIRQETRGHWRVWQENDGCSADNDSHQSEDKEHHLPASECRIHDVLEGE